MEIKYPIILLINIILFIGLVFIKVKGSKDNNNKNKVANTSFIKKTNAYKKMLKKYRFLLYLFYGIIFVCLMATALLSSRIVKEETVNNDIYNRDIILCMDVSTSVDDLNIELVDSYKEVVKNLNGERFGISIFNTSSYLLVPLTMDYNYVTDSLDTLSKAFDVNKNSSNYDPDEYLYLRGYLYYGTLVGNQERGSSLAGDGLASCIFDFPDLDENRSRIIIFSTDNDVYGTEYIDVTKAAKIGKKKDITIYSIAPSTVLKEDASSLKEVSNITGGEYYVHAKDKTVKEIVKEIESKEKSLLKGPSKKVIIDFPIVPFLITLISFIVLIIIEKVVLS